MFRDPGENGQTIDPACAIVMQKSGNKWLMVARDRIEKSLVYYDLTSDNGWHFASRLPANTHQWGMNMVSLTAQDTIMVGGHTSWLGHKLRNLFVFNKDSFKFEVCI